MGAVARVASRSSALQNGQPGFNQRIELLIEDQEVVAADFALFAHTRASAHQAVARLDGIDIQSAVGQLLAGFIQGCRRFHVREDSPVGVGYAAYKFAHRSLVYLIRRVPQKESVAGGFVSQLQAALGDSPLFLHSY